MGDVTEAESQGFDISSPRDVARPQSGAESRTIFQIGDGHLVLDSTDNLLAERFRRLYGDCVVDEPAAGGARVECIVSAAAGNEIVADVHDTGSVDLGLFMETTFADRGCRRMPPFDAEWQAMASLAPRATFRVRGRRVVFAAESEWRALTANLAVGLLLRLQQDIIYLHAAGLAMGARRRGVLFVGPKGSGKTTTALGLASRGHAFLGDELVGVRHATGELVPVRRTIAKRDGPCAEAVDRVLAGLTLDRAQYPDGHSRTIVPASRLFPPRPPSAALEAIVFLDGFGPVPTLTPMRPSLDVASKLTPVASTLWGLPPASRAFALVRLLTSVSSYRLQLGPPDVTAQLIEDTFI